MSSWRSLVIRVFLPALFLTSVLAAQESRGKILGRVLDATGGLIPGASRSEEHTSELQSR